MRNLYNILISWIHIVHYAHVQCLAHKEHPIGWIHLLRFSDPETIIHCLILVHKGSPHLATWLLPSVPWGSVANDYILSETFAFRSWADFLPMQGNSSTVTHTRYNEMSLFVLYLCSPMFHRTKLKLFPHSRATKPSSGAQLFCLLLLFLVGPTSFVWLSALHRFDILPGYLEFSYISS